ncbi:MAG: transposase [Thermoplasmata archaeon]
MIPPSVGLSSREKHALEMHQSGVRAAEGKKPGEYLVPSQSGKGFYRVWTIGPFGPAESCECPDFAERQAACKHIYFVRAWEKDSGQAAPSLPNLASQQVHRKRDWASYDRAQIMETRVVRRLLRDLSNGFPEPPKDPRLAGRKPVPLRDQVFCAVQRSYHGYTLRDSQDLRAQAVEKEFLSSPHSYSLVSHFLCREDVTAGLHDMLARSAIPLIGVENTCAIDSTGLRTSRFNYYRHEKYEPSRENIWLKFHALVGVKTHTIPVLEVTAGSVSDSPQLPILLKRATAYGFEFGEAYADKGYQGRPNFNAAAELGILLFIPFKVGQTGQTKGSPLYHKMFHYYQAYREDFDRHYGQRAQVESTFASFKQKLSETLASRKFTSQVNEILCMAIAHNLMVLVRQMYETNLLPEFLRPPSASPSKVQSEARLEESLFLNRTAHGPLVPQSILPN